MSAGTDCTLDCHAGSTLSIELFSLASLVKNQTCGGEGSCLINIPNNSLLSLVTLIFTLVNCSHSDAHAPSYYSHSDTKLKATSRFTQPPCQASFIYIQFPANPSWAVLGSVCFNVLSARCLAVPDVTVALTSLPRIEGTERGICLSVAE